ncbi:MAG: glycosyltransferase family 2 protein [Cytophagaceae bacterium]
MQGTINKISVVTPVYNEEKNLPELCVRLHITLSELKYPFEIIFVNDGSSDKSSEIIGTLAQAYSEVKGIDLAGNYGQTIAIRAGIENADGDIIVLMDSDLQHDPQDIPLFIDEIKNGHEVVGGAKASRPEKGFKKWISEKAHLWISNLVGVKMSYFGGTFKAYRSYLLHNSNLLTDNHRFLGALVVRKGIKYKEIPITIYPRIYGTSNYSMNKVGKVFLDIIYLKFFVSFITKPFRLLGTIGVSLFLLGSLGTLWYLFGNLFLEFNIKEDYFMEFLFSISLVISGLLFLSLGIITQLSVMQYFQRKHTSPYIIRHILQQPSHEKNNTISC